MGWGGGIGSAWLGILLMVFEKNLPPIKKRLIWAKEFYPGQFHSHFSSAQNQQNPHRRLTVSRPTRRIRGPRLTAVNLCRLFRRRAPNASAVSKIFVRHPKRTFATVSARNGHADSVPRCPLSGAKQKTCARIELFRF